MKKLFFLTVTVISLLSAKANTGLFDNYIILTLNGGALSYYDLATNTANPDFTGSLGIFDVSLGNTLVLNGGQNKTWKNNNCGSEGTNILNGTLFYRVYLQGGPAPAFIPINLPFYCNWPDAGCPGANPGDQAWQTTAANLNLTNGLSNGIYVLEVYNSADYDGCGTGTHYLSNGGANYSATFIVTGSTAPVFVEAFTASRMAGSGYVQVNWKVSCINTQYADMEVLYSTDGRYFTTINSRRESAQNCGASFSFIHTNTQAPVQYYRLKLSDDNGIINYSWIVVVYTDKNVFKGSVLPNPVSGNQLQYFVSASGVVSINCIIYDATGRQVKNQRFILPAGATKINADVASLQTGTYLLKVITGNGISELHRFIKN